MIPNLSELIGSDSALFGGDERADEPAESDSVLGRRSYLKMAGVSALGLGSYLRSENSKLASEAVTYGYGGGPVAAKQATGGSASTAGVTRMIEEGGAAAMNDAQVTGASQNAYVRRLPGRIQAEDFDSGGEGVSYHDTDAENRFGAYRPDSGVDIQETSDSSGRFNVGAIADGEWLEYTVRIPDGTYDISVRVASESRRAGLRFILGGSKLGTVTLPSTDGLQNWVTTTMSGIDIEADGNTTLRIEAVGGDCSLNWFEVTTIEQRETATPASTSTATPRPTLTLMPTSTETATPTPTPTETATPTPTPTETATPTPTPTPMPTDEYGEVGYGEMGYGG